MERFKKVEPVIKAKELENRVADQHQNEEKTIVKKKLEKDPKYFIKRNMASLHKVNNETQYQISKEEYKKNVAKAKVESRYGVLPTYLVNRKKQAEAEHQQTLLEIQLNQRP